MGKEDVDDETKKRLEASFTEECLKNLKVFHTSQMPDFDANVHKWIEWKERLEIHMEDISCEGEKSKAAQLLKSLSTEPYGLLRALCNPDKPSSKSYTELISIMNTHYMPPTIIYRERLNFYKSKKNSNETVTAWYARVKKLAFLCKFDALDTTLRDQFVIGMENEEKIFDKLCEEDETLTLSAALKKACIMESKKLAKSSNHNQVNHVRGSFKSRSNSGNPKKGTTATNATNNNIQSELQHR